MVCIRARLTVLFDAPFWVGIYEREMDHSYEVCEVTFGAEPKDYEVYAFLQANWQHLHFSPSMEADCFVEKYISPKRIQRVIAREVEGACGIGTKAQQALKLQREQGKTTRKRKSREQKELEIERQFSLRQEKRKEKHRGH